MKRLDDVRTHLISVPIRTSGMRKEEEREEDISVIRKGIKCEEFCFDAGTTTTSITATNATATTNTFNNNTASTYSLLCLSSITVF